MDLAEEAAAGAEARAGAGAGTVAGVRTVAGAGIPPSSRKGGEYALWQAQALFALGEASGDAAKRAAATRLLRSLKTHQVRPFPRRTCLFPWSHDPVAVVQDSAAAGAAAAARFVCKSDTARPHLFFPRKVTHCAMKPTTADAGPRRTRWVVAGRTGRWAGWRARSSSSSRRRGWS